MINYGTSEVSKIYLGKTPIKYVYKGTTKIWPVTDTPTVKPTDYYLYIGAQWYDQQTWDSIWENHYYNHSEYGYGDVAISLNFSGYVYTILNDGTELYEDIGTSSDATSVHLSNLYSKPSFASITIDSAYIICHTCGQSESEANYYSVDGQYWVPIGQSISINADNDGNMSTVLYFKYES